MNPTTFRTAVASTVRELSLSETNWKAQGWQKLWQSITQEDLNDAFKQHGSVRETFKDLGEITTRTPKSLERAEQKMTDSQAPGRENYFRVVSDFVAVRVPCEVSQIPAKICTLKNIVLANKGEMHVRGSSDERPYGFCLGPDKKFTDIMQFAYVFLDKIGYPIEFQIGHPFAAHTFTIDSALRDEPTCGKVDLWTKGFYSDVKTHLLEKANGEAPSVPLKALLHKADELHNGNTPDALKSILEKM